MGGWVTRPPTIENGRFLADRVPDARLHELEGDDQAFLFSGQPLVLAALEELLAHEARRG